MGETIKIKGADGFEFSAYHEPAFTPRKGGVIVLQEIFGVNAHIRAVADGFAKHGLVAMAMAMPSMPNILPWRLDSGLESPRNARMNRTPEPR